jgi:hypothetical protein
VIATIVVGLIVFFAAQNVLATSIVSIIGGVIAILAFCGIDIKFLRKKIISNQRIQIAKQLLLALNNR